MSQPEHRRCGLFTSRNFTLASLRGFVAGFAMSAAPFIVAWFIMHEPLRETVVPTEAAEPANESVAC